MKTDKYTNMLEAFECDLLLAKNNSYSLSELDKALQDKDSRISKDLELLEELSFLLRNGKAEINLVSENATSDIHEKYICRYIAVWRDVDKGLYDHARDAFNIEMGKLAMLLMLSDVKNKECEEYKLEVLHGLWEARYYNNEDK